MILPQAEVLNVTLFTQTNSCTCLPIKPLTVRYGNITYGIDGRYCVFVTYNYTWD